MPGSFGGTAKADGVRGTTTGKDSAGIFGKNDATAAPTKGGDGGAGVLGVTAAPSAAGVFGANTHASKGAGVQGNGPEAGVSGFTDGGAGVRGHSNHGNGAEAFAHDGNGNAVLAINDATAAPTKTDGSPRGCGVLGVTSVPNGAGVFGANNSGTGVGLQGNGPDVGASGYSHDGVGVRGVSNNGNGVFGFATPERLIAKVVPGLAVREKVRSQLLQRDQGVQGAIGGRGRVTVQDAVVSALQTAGDLGVGHSSHRAPAGLLVTPAQAFGAVQQDRGPVGNGVWGHTNVPRASGVFGSADPRARGSAGVTGIGSIAGQFFGNAVVTVNLSVGGGVSVGGDVNVAGDVILTGADIAEDFDAVDLGDAEPGTVMVIGEDGSLRPSGSSYDAAVAGVISAAGDFRPGVVLDRGPAVGRPRVTLALVGKVFCWVDAGAAPVKPGDLLTTSALRGHAMKVTDPLRAMGAVLGKALRPLSGGQALLPILVALQ